MLYVIKLTRNDESREIVYSNQSFDRVFNCYTRRIRSLQDGESMRFERVNEDDIELVFAVRRVNGRLFNGKYEE